MTTQIGIYMYIHLNLKQR